MKSIILALFFVLALSGSAFAYCGASPCPVNCFYDSWSHDCVCYNDCADTYSTTPENPKFNDSSISVAGCSGYHRSWFSGGWFIYYDCCWNGTYEEVWRSSNLARYCRKPPIIEPNHCQGITCNEGQVMFSDCSCGCNQEQIDFCAARNDSTWHSENCSCMCNLTRYTDIYLDDSSNNFVTVKLIDEDEVESNYSGSVCLYRWQQTGGGGTKFYEKVKSFYYALMEWIVPLAYASPCPVLGENYKFMGVFASSIDLRGLIEGNYTVYIASVRFYCDEWANDIWLSFSKWGDRLMKPGASGGSLRQGYKKSGMVRKGGGGYEKRDN